MNIEYKQMNGMGYSQSDPFQGITEVQNNIQCSKRNKQSRVIQITIIINMDNWCR